MKFDQLLYNDSVLDALDAMHFVECTPIQEQAIPIVEDGRDLIAIAQTGTGKTAAYLLPVIDIIADGGYPEDAINCIVLAPTRELIKQIDQQMQGFSYFMPVSSVAIYGGTDGSTFEQQKQGLKLGADVVIATPGRLLAHLQMGYVDLSQVSFFILDEADRMLDMGFFDDIMHIVSQLPKERQTLLFSATMPPKIRNLAQQILRDPAEVKIAPSRPAEKIDQTVYFVDETCKEDLLCRMFKADPPERVIVFSSSKVKVKQLARKLRSRNINVAEMHSDLEQNARENVMLDFKAGRTKVVVATDIIARGIDIDDIELVVNFDVPHDPEDYVHRVGRTARAGRGGRATTFVSALERRKFDAIERLIGDQIHVGDLPEGITGPNPNSRPLRDAKKPGQRRQSDRRHHRSRRQPRQSADQPQQGNKRRRWKRNRGRGRDRHNGGGCATNNQPQA